MKAAFVTDVEKVEICDIDCPEIQPNEVLIKVRTAGVCGSDIHLFRGTHAFRKPPAILGHEVAGDVVKVGANVTKIKVGDRVTVEPHVGCGKCEFCHRELTNICDNKIAPGTPKWIGSFVEYFNAPEDKIYKVNDNVSYELATLIEPLAVAVHAMRRAAAERKDCVVILGAGTIGLLTLVVARELGYKKIICTDTVEDNCKMALKQGATAAFNPLTEDVPARVRELTNGRGADLAIIAAGADNILDQASQCVCKRGEIGLVAMITKKIPFYCYSVVFNEQTIYGSMTYESKDFKEAADMINNGLDLNDFITQKLPLEKTQEALDILSQKKEYVVKVIVEVA